MSGPLWTSLPEGWRSAQMKNAATVTLGKMLQGKDSGQDVSAPYLRAANVQPDGVLAVDDWKEMWFDSTELERLSIHRGDVVVVEGGQGGFGRAAFVRTDLGGWGFQNSINRLRPVAGADGRFLAYYLIALRASGYIHAYANVVSMPHLTADKLERLSVPLPPAESQRAIANYLDRETARIDTLIEAQQLLIEMLRERRAAQTSLATGWGSDLPEGWSMMRLSWLFEATASGTTPANEDITYDEDAEFPWVTTGELRETVVESTLRGVSAEVIEKYSALRTHPAGSLLIAMYGATIGRMGILGVDATSNQACCALVGPTHAVPEFVQYSLQSAKQQLLLEAAGGGQPNINQEKIRSFRIPTPPLAEQRRIRADLDASVGKIDELIAETERFIELSRERRAALITAAVTGQIDVREVA
ncbi:restriction endonuclease subunit S [Janibacter indicus]|uniref:restriction endonuclease subunit S n=1 Tax=Janibacter indicus TaxID=857417 RepID=UPI003EB82A5A